MNDNAVLASVPRWSHDRVLFEIDDQGERVYCSISKAAIQEASERRTNLPSELMLQFTKLQERIVAAARAKLHARSNGGAVLHLWSSDLDDDPMPTVPAAAIQP